MLEDLLSSSNLRRMTIEFNSVEVSPDQNCATELAHPYRKFYGAVSVKIFFDGS
jgi:hypothetical protein